MEPASLEDTQDAIGFGGNQDGADPPTVEEQIAALWERMENLEAAVGKILEAVTPKPED